MDVSIVIVNFNTNILLRNCLLSIREKTEGILYEIIVVDNGSTDGSQQMIKADFNEVIVIENSDNIGFGKANNAGILVSKGKYVFLLNSDTYLLDNALLQFMLYMDSHPEVACCGGDLFDAGGQRQISFGNFPTVFEAFSQIGFMVFYKAYFKRHLASAVINYDDLEKEVDYICGADMFIRKSVLTQTGNFDPDFFLYFEETELSFRFKNMGFKSVLLPAIKIVHLEGGSQKVSSDFNFNKISIFAKSRNIYFRKCYGLFNAICAKIFFTLHSLLLFLIKRKSEYLRIAKIIIYS